MQRCDVLGVTCSVCPGYTDVLITIKSNNPEFESRHFTFDPNIGGRGNVWVDICIETFFGPKNFRMANQDGWEEKVSLCLEFPLISNRFADCHRAAFMTLHMIAAKYPGCVIASGVWRMCSKCSQLFKLPPPVSEWEDEGLGLITIPNQDSHWYTQCT